MAVKQEQRQDRFHFELPAELKARAEVMAQARERKLAAETRLALKARVEEFEAEAGPNRRSR